MPDANTDLSFAQAREPAPILHRTLTAGTRGHDVARLQAGLRRAGLVPGTIDGVFGDKTTAATAAFATREKLPPPAGSVDAALFAAILRSAALAQADALEQLARSHEQLATAARDESAVAQKDAADRRTQAANAGPDEERAAGLLQRAGLAYRTAADLWLASATAIAPHADPDARSVKAHARALNDLDLARSHATRAVNSLALAGKDFEAAGSVDHRERIAAATLAASTLAST